jgi:hypothetical protein
MLQREVTAQEKLEKDLAVVDEDHMSERDC